MAKPGLRERKKAATRATIIETADELFLERGFSNVTLDEVADVCEVSVRTVLRYFDSKEALALARDYDGVARLREGLEKHTGSVLDYWRYHVGMVSAELSARQDWYRRHFLMIREAPLLVGALRVLREAQHLLTHAFQQELQDVDPLTPHLVAASLIAGNEAVIDDWIRDGGDFNGDALLHVVDYVAEVFGAYLGVPAAGARRQ